MDTNYQVNSSYTGAKSITVPVRMYSRNSLLGASHIKSKRFLGVDLSRNMLTFHKSKYPQDHTNKSHEIPFSKVTNIETDVSKASSNKYYMKVHTSEGDLKFKFKNAHDFHNVADALANVTHNSKAIHQTSEEYKTFNSHYLQNKTQYKGTAYDASRVKTTADGKPRSRSSSRSSVSSDSDKEYKLEDEKDRVKKQRKEAEKYEKEQEKYAKEQQKDAEKYAKEQQKNAEKAEKEFNKANIDSINDAQKYAEKQEKRIHDQVKHNIDNTADQAKQQYKH